jgi:hypothetical protein
MKYYWILPGKNVDQVTRYIVSFYNTLYNLYSVYKESVIISWHQSMSGKIDHSAKLWLILTRVTVRFQQSAT